MVFGDIEGKASRDRTLQENGWSIQVKFCLTHTTAQSNLFSLPIEIDVFVHQRQCNGSCGINSIPLVLNKLMLII
jgi:hypothetical protein